MKNLRYIIVAMLLLGMGACADAQIRRTVYGNKKVVTKERTSDSFTGIRVSTGIDVYLTQGNKTSIAVEADENLHEYIVTEVRNGTLNVYSDANIRSAEMKRVYVTMKEINMVSTSSAGDVVGQTQVRTDNLKLNASSAGDIKLEVYAKNIEADISSSGDITLSGEADMLRASLSSAGDLNSYNLRVREADVSASSAGSADIYVTERLNARSSSAGDVNYKGDPKYINAHSSSAGSISRK